VVHRHNLRSTIGSLAAILTKAEPIGELTSTAPTLAAQASLRDAAVAAEGDLDDEATPPSAAHAE
jgi:acetyl-CoA carboxylase carboxyl transferase subunit beta